MAQWLAYALPYRRFAPALADGNARLGADAVRYSFIVVDLHLLLLAGLPAHAQRYPSDALSVVDLSQQIGDSNATRVDIPVRWDIIDFTAAYADIHQFPVTQVRQSGL